MKAIARTTHNGNLEEQGLYAARILVIDDQEANVRLLRRLLHGAGYSDVESTTDPTKAADLSRRFDPDLVILDLQMPRRDGFAVMDEMYSTVVRANEPYLPILVVTADRSEKAKRRALSVGAKDFLINPFDKTEFLLRVANLLETRNLHKSLARYNENLQEQVRIRTAELADSLSKLGQAEQQLLHAQDETIRRLSIAAEFRDDDTGRHVERMSRYSVLLAEAVGLDNDRCEEIGRASQMHDVGKIGIPDHILLKPAPLTSEERTIMQRHSSIGYDILSGSGSDLLELAATIALTHHERPDGCGYPQSLASSSIPIEGRIAAIADVFDALTSDRVYRPAFSVPDATQVLIDGRGTQFDPHLVDLFLEIIPTIPQNSIGSASPR